MKFGETLINLMAPVLEGAATEQGKDLLSKLYAKSPEAHKSCVQALSIGFKHLEDLADKTKTKIDNAIVDGLQSAVEESAEEFGVELPE